MIIAECQCSFPFPFPYPDENLYSVLCRYHVRSGHHSIARTKKELFGNPAISLASSHTGTNLLQYARRWRCQNIPSPDYPSLLKTTVAQISSLFLHSSEVAGSDKQLLPIIQSNNRALQIDQKTFLRFCPACAKAEKIIYGEPYWHLSHQVKMISHCHIHKQKLIASNVPISSTNYYFVPAFTVINDTDVTKTGIDESFQGSLLEKIESDYIWLLTNAHKLGNQHIIEEKYYNGLSASGMLLPQEISKSKRVRQFNTAYRLLRNKFLKILPENHKSAPPFKALIQPCLRTDALKISIPDSIESNVLYMRLVYGGAENFYYSEYSETSIAISIPYWQTREGIVLLKNAI